MKEIKVVYKYGRLITSELDRAMSGLVYEDKTTITAAHYVTIVSSRCNRVLEEEDRTIIRSQPSNKGYDTTFRMLMAIQ